MVSMEQLSVYLSYCIDNGECGMHQAACRSGRCLQAIATRPPRQGKEIAESGTGSR